MGHVNHEPSMEDILASIKRIIAEDEPAAPGPSRTARARREPPGEALAEPAADADVLELTRPLEESPPAAGDSPAAVASTPPEPSITESAPAMPESTASDAPDILSGATADASRQALAALSALVVKPEQPGNTLEGLVREMLRPMLREWLDAELPAIVERLVSGEIARISGRQA